MIPAGPFRHSGFPALLLPLTPSPYTHLLPPYPPADVFVLPNPLLPHSHHCWAALYSLNLLQIPLPPSLAAQSFPCSLLAISHSLSSKHLHKKIQSWWQPLAKCLADGNCQPCRYSVPCFLSSSLCQAACRQHIGSRGIHVLPTLLSFTLESSCSLKPREVQAAIILLAGSPQHMRANQTQFLQPVF